MSPLEEHIAIVRAAGYRVSKPKPKRKAMRGPTCVCTFADESTYRMSTYCDDDALDYTRGVNLCKAAWGSRNKLDASQAPAVVSVHFERDGETIGQQIAA